uniref:Uncharacterized protein n=1 Tax=Meloidogyne enterolobii TaxID=390850 RepID=A0A6V7TVA2_MELEN|nr:unnamed protein product [Meloidogyne enterolobii]
MLIITGLAGNKQYNEDMVNRIKHYNNNLELESLLSFVVIHHGSDLLLTTKLMNIGATEFKLTKNDELINFGEKKVKDESSKINGKLSESKNKLKKIELKEIESDKVQFKIKLNDSKNVANEELKEEFINLKYEEILNKLNLRQAELYEEISELDTEDMKMGKKLLKEFNNSKEKIKQMVDGKKEMMEELKKINFEEDEEDEKVVIEKMGEELRKIRIKEEKLKEEYEEKLEGKKKGIEEEKELKLEEDELKKEIEKNPNDKHVLQEIKDDRSKLKKELNEELEVETKEYRKSLSGPENKLKEFEQKNRSEYLKKLDETKSMKDMLSKTKFIFEMKIEMKEEMKKIKREKFVKEEIEATRQKLREEIAKVEDEKRKINDEINNLSTNAERIKMDLQRFEQIDKDKLGIFSFFNYATSNKFNSNCYGETEKEYEMEVKLGSLEYEHKVVFKKKNMLKHLIEWEAFCEEVQDFSDIMGTKYSKNVIEKRNDFETIEEWINGSSEHSINKRIEKLTEVCLEVQKHKR